MRKAKVKLSLHRKPIPAKVEMGRSIYDSMNGNPVFVAPSPSLAILKSVTDALEAAFIERQSGAHKAVATMHTAEELFDKVMTAMGAYVDNIAQGSEVIIVSAGMQVRRAKSSVGIPVKVENLRGFPADVLGVIHLRWKRVYGKKSYNIYMKMDGEGDEQYRLAVQSTKASVTLEGLKSAQYYWFRVETLGSAGKGALSDAAKVIAF
jgi:hypothetical protein